MLNREFVIGARDRAFQEAPDVFNAVRINIYISTDVLFVLMGHNLVLHVGIPGTAIGTLIISDNDLGLRSRMLFDKTIQRLSIRPFNHLQSDFAALAESP
jgi:hypothetical protein